jgi:hypothetical protein
MNGDVVSQILCGNVLQKTQELDGQNYYDHYFNPIKFIVVDPMHCLFLGIARWIVKRIWVDEGILNQQSLIKIQKKWMSFRFHPIWAEYQKKSTAEKDFQTLLRTNGEYFLQYTLRFHSGAIFQNMIEKFFIIL